MDEGGGGGGGIGFAMDEYVTPRHGPAKEAQASTIPKASLEVGGLFSQVTKSSKVPGPEHYNKDFLDKTFNKDARGGTFSKLTREWGSGKNAKAPSVGQYNIMSGQTTPRVHGGLMCKTDRGCYFLDRAIRQTRDNPAPGKYSGDQPSKHTATPAFTQTKTESRQPAKSNPVGPGYYNVDHKNVEKTSISYSSSKQATKSFLDGITKSKAAVPAPGHNGIPDPKGLDRAGHKMHTQRLLHDQMVSPRRQATGQSEKPSSVAESTGGIGAS